MNISDIKMDLIRPEIFKDERRVQAFFTLKNADKINTEETIPGLDLGFNTNSVTGITEKNRNLLFKELNLDPDWVAFGNQVHGTRIQFVTAGGVYPETDGLVTNVPGLALAIQVADCAVVLLADPEAKIIGAVHAGWRGAAGNIVLEAVKIMSRNGSELQNVKAYISPCISLSHFEVGEEIAEQFPDEFIDRGSYKKPHVDLKRFLNHQLLEAGIKPTFIEVDEGCTIDESERFYSYRREKENAGRMLGIIKLEKE